MDIYNCELQQKVLAQMRRENIEDFSDEELERVFSDFDVDERTYLEVAALLVDNGLTIENLYSSRFCER